MAILKKHIFLFVNAIPAKLPIFLLWNLLEKWIQKTRFWKCILQNLAKITVSETVRDREKRTIITMVIICKSSILSNFRNLQKKMILPFLVKKVLNIFLGVTRVIICKSDIFWKFKNFENFAKCAKFAKIAEFAIFSKFLSRLGSQGDDMLEQQNLQILEFF